MGRKKNPDYLYRKGKYLYFRHPVTDKLTPLPPDQTSQEFADAYGPLKRAVQFSNVAPSPKIESGKIVYRAASVGWLIDKFKLSAKWTGYSDGTRTVYGYALNLLKTELGTGMLHDMKPEHVDVYSARIAREYGGSTADQQINLISNLWEFAKGFPEFKRKGRHCPTLGATRHYQHDGVGHLAWPDDLLERFDETAPSYLAEYKTGLHYTGQRGSDVVTMRWTDYDGTLINIVQQKTGERVWLNCPDEFKKMLDRMQKNPAHPEFIFVNKWKRPYADAGSLSDSLRNHLLKIGGDDYSMHGLRKNAGMELAIAGCEVAEIMAVLGHTSPKMAMFYVKQANKMRLSRTATAKWNAYIKENKARRIAERRSKMRPV